MSNKHYNRSCNVDFYRFQVAKMYRNLFIAWYCLGVIALYLLTFFIRLPLIGLERAQSSFAVFALIGLLPIFCRILFRKEQNDERDVSFAQRSMGIGLVNGFATIFFLNGLVMFVYEFRFGLDSIPFSVFWLPATGGLVVGTLIFSVMLLLFYYKGEHADAED